MKTVSSIFFFLLPLMSVANPSVKLTASSLGIAYALPFKINVNFSEPVTGFGKSSMNVVNAIVNNISGNKANYTITLTPEVPGAMTIFLPSNVVRSLVTGSPNNTSNKLNIMALNPVLNPSSNFDLSSWTLTLPLPLGVLGSAISISNTTLVGYATLNTGYSNPPYFYTDPVTGSMNFFAPLNGATTTGSVFPRSLLSEKLPAIGPPTTWKIQTYDSNILMASVLVTQVPPSKRIIVGEISDKGDTDTLGQEVGTKTLVKIYYDLNPFDPNGLFCNGCIYATIRSNPAQQIHLNTIQLANNTPLNKLFQYKINLQRNGTLNVKVNDASATVVLNTTADNTIGWGAQQLNFKAGVYIQDNGSSNAKGGAANFYALKIKHLGCPLVP